MPIKRCLLDVAVTCAMLSLLIGTASLQAATPVTKKMPPPGIEVPAAKRDLLQQKLDCLGAQIAEFVRRQDGRIHELMPDVRIFWQAVHTALADKEFYNARDIEAAFALLDEGHARAAALAKGRRPGPLGTGWSSAAMSHAWTARSSLMGWLFPRLTTSATAKRNIGSTSGCMAAARR